MEYNDVDVVAVVYVDNVKLMSNDNVTTQQHAVILIDSQALRVPLFITLTHAEHTINTNTGFSYLFCSKALSDPIQLLNSDDKKDGNTRDLKMLKTRNQHI